MLLFLFLATLAFSLLQVLLLDVVVEVFYPGFGCLSELLRLHFLLLVNFIEVLKLSLGHHGCFLPLLASLLFLFSLCCHSEISLSCWLLMLVA